MLAGKKINADFLSSYHQDVQNYVYWQTTSKRGIFLRDVLYINSRAICELIGLKMHEYKMFCKQPVEL